jgi:predicted cupin superfamily sugar epimerase
VIVLLSMSDHDKIEKIIKELNLAPLPSEGGYYAESFRSSIMIPKDSLALTYPGARTASTAIYFLLTSSDFSAMHRVPGAEIFHLYMGGPVETTLLYEDGTGKVVTIGKEIEFGDRPQLVVPGGVWQGSRLAPNNESFALLGATITPGFEFKDYEHGVRDKLIESHPDFTDEITRLTR